jgi:hypothetical protein
MSRGPIQLLVRPAKRSVREKIDAHIETLSFFFDRIFVENFV